MSNVRRRTRMKCSLCKSKIGVLSPEWQAQRELKIKKCPSCGSEVEAVFGGATFAKWLVAAGAVVAAVTFLISRSVPLAAINGLIFGMFVALFPSLELRARPNSSSGASRALNRTIDLPPWLKPPAWLLNFANSVWAVGSYLFVLIAVTLGVPFPWSAVLLVVLGAIGLIRRTSPDKEPQGTAIVSKVGAIGMLVLGVGLVVHHYA
jgi:hypothetical protein